MQTEHEINSPRPLGQRQQESHYGRAPSRSAFLPRSLTMRGAPNLPKHNLATRGSREDYFTFCVPLFEASLRCNWAEAITIIEKKRDLVRYGITDNGETALHIVASANGPKNVVEHFVKNLVAIMEEEDLKLENENCCTALYMAAVAGNIETVKILVNKNKELLTIAGDGGDKGMMPLNAAAVFGNQDVVRYLYEKSNNLGGGHWNNENRASLLEKCVEGNMFDVALKIMRRYPQLGNRSNLLAILAQKPDSVYEKKPNIIKRRSILAQNRSITRDEEPDVGYEKKPNIIKKLIIWAHGSIDAVFALVGLKIRGYGEKSEALQVLETIWEDIAKNERKDIDKILKDSITQNEKKEDVNQALNLQNNVREVIDMVEIIQKKYQRYITAEIAQDLLELEKLISQHVKFMDLETKNMLKQGDKHVSSKKILKLKKVISKHSADMTVDSKNIMKYTKEKEYEEYELEPIFYHLKLLHHHATLTLKEFGHKSCPALFIATEMGNTRFVVELIRRYPELIWARNDEDHTVFHIAVKHRQEGIYKLLYEIGAMRDMIISINDTKGNNMLHLVANVSKQKRLEDVSGVALQMQKELLWFEEVKNMIPPKYREQENEDGITPHELFTKEHKELVTQGEKWMKETASQCMVVATLIATIVFAAAFTVPGGYDQNNGIPIFHSKVTFMVFVVADAISLFSSSASVLMFLSILTSRYAERDFLVSLPTKLMVGLLTLFLSITSMMIAFSVSFFVLYRDGFLWTPILLAVFAMIPVALYIALQFRLFFDVILSTYHSRHLFKPNNHVLYYKNPNV